MMLLDILADIISEIPKKKPPQSAAEDIIERLTIVIPSVIVGAADTTSYCL